MDKSMIALAVVVEGEDGFQAREEIAAILRTFPQVVRVDALSWNTRSFSTASLVLAEDGWAEARGH